MLASSFLDTAIGIIFVFLLLSLIASTVNEIILSTMSKRGKFLLRGLKTLLDDASATGLVSQIYNHGQIFGLYQGSFDPNKPRNLPSYIPANNFAMAFLGILPEAPVAVAAAQEAKATKAAAVAKAAAGKVPNDTEAGEKADALQRKAETAKTARETAEQSAKDAKAALANILLTAKAGIGLPAATAAAQVAARKVVAAVQAAEAAKTTAETDPANNAAAENAKALAAEAEAANQAKVAADKALAEQASGVQISVAFQSLKAVARDLADNPASEKVGKPLLEMMNQAGEDINKLKSSLEAWYDSAMDRVSGWYKYHTQWMLFWIGIVLAVALNANTIVIVQQLSKDATLRQSIVAAVQSVKPASGSDGTANIAEVKKQVAEIQELGIPLGWKSKWPTSCAEWSAWVDNYPVLLKASPGLLLTAIAISLGAPFWFDLLNKFMMVRSTVKPQQTGKEEGPKDKSGK